MPSEIATPAGRAGGSRPPAALLRSTLRRAPSARRRLRAAAGKTIATAIPTRPARDGPCEQGAGDIDGNLHRGPDRSLSRRPSKAGVEGRVEERLDEAHGGAVGVAFVAALSRTTSSATCWCARRRRGSGRAALDDAPDGRLARLRPASGLGLLPRQGPARALAPQHRPRRAGELARAVTVCSTTRRPGSAIRTGAGRAGSSA